MAKKRPVRKHTVKAGMRVLEMTKAGSAMELEIFSDNEKLGTIEIGRGSFTWYGKGRTNGKRIGWTKFSQMMDKYCYE